jgi:hypothetical protein
MLKIFSLFINKLYFKRKVGTDRVYNLPTVNETDEQHPTELIAQLEKER